MKSSLKTLRSGLRIILGIWLLILILIIFVTYKTPVFGVVNPINIFDTATIWLGSLAIAISLFVSLLNYFTKNKE